MSGWLSSTPDVLFVLAVLGVPGLVLARSLRFGIWDSVGLSVPLSLGALALTDEASIHGHVRWGLPVIAGTTLVLALLCLAAVRLGDRFLGTTPPHADATVEGAVWSVRQHQIAVLATLGAAIVGAIVVARGIGSPGAINQTFDGAFHVNSINAVAQRHLASPSLFAGLSDGSSGGGFYPPTFGAVAGLLALYTGVNAINAANITALAIAILWPITLSLAVRRIARPTAFGYAIAMAGSVTVGLYPALLLRFGTLWPNTLSYLALAPGLVVVLRLFELDQAEGGANDSHGRTSWLATVLVALIAIPGLIFAHPGAAYMLFYLAIPALIWFGWRRFVVRSQRDVRGRALLGAAVFAVVGVLFVGAVWVSARIPAIASVRHKYWPPTQSWDQAAGHVLFLGSNLSAPNLAMAVLAVAGILVGLWHARGRYLIAGYVIIGVMAVWTSAVQTPSTMRWTGFWYNDPFRIFAALPVLALPLIALGADGLRDQIRDGVGRFVEAGHVRWPSRILSVPLAAGLAVCLGVLLLQGGLGTHRVSATVAQSYGDAPLKLLTPDEAAMFRRLGEKVPAGQAIAGDPFTGEILAGVLSGHPIIYPTFGQPRSKDRVLVAEQFDQYRSNPQVCAAVKRLNIGVVISGPRYFMETPSRQIWYPAFDSVATIPGLTPIDSGGGAVAYRVGSCKE
ncbi:MAG: hypothetical protein NVSMB48_08590 [Marmoricola sp.]